MIRPAHVFVLVLTLGLGACSTVGSVAGRVAEPRFGLCPAATILTDAAVLTQYQGDGRDLPNIHFNAEITELDARCDYGRVWGQRYVYSRVEITFEMELGSAAYPAPIRIPYFVALIRPATEQVITKEVFLLDVPFDGSHRVLRLEDNIDRIAIPVETNSEGGNYEIVIGFELTPEQVAFNRQREF